LCFVDEFQRTWIVEENPCLVASESEALPHCLAGAAQHFGDLTKMVAMKKPKD